jgi:Family of unknown function (DUF5677)
VPGNCRMGQVALAVAVGATGFWLSSSFLGKVWANRIAAEETDPLIDPVEDYVTAVRQLVNNLGIHTPNIADGPFASILLAHLSKVFALANSCLILLRQQHPDEAFGLARTIVECAANLRYLTQSPAEQTARARLFVEYAEKERRYWLEQIRAHVEDSEIVQDAEDFAEVSEVEKTGHKPMSALGHWSGLSNFVWKAMEMDHPLDDPSSPLPLSLPLRKKMYAEDYHSPSNYVHCSERGLRNYYPIAGQVYSVGSSFEEYDKIAVTLLHLIVVHLHESARYSLFGLGISPSASLYDLVTPLFALFGGEDIS